MRLRRMPTVLLVTAALGVSVAGLAACSKTNRPTATISTSSTTATPAVSFFANPPTTAPHVQPASP